VERSSIERILNLTKVLDIYKQNIEYIYISYSTTAEFKFINSKTIVQQVDQFKNYIIFKISVNIVNKLKY